MLPETNQTNSKNSLNKQLKEENLSLKSSQLNLHAIFLSFVICFLILFTNCARKQVQHFPTTKKIPVTDVYHGIEVIDNYRWLDNLNDPKVRKWNDEQNRYTRSILDEIPFRSAIYERLKEVRIKSSSVYYSLIMRNVLFAMKHQPPKNQPFLVTLNSVNDLKSEKVVVDPNELNPEGTTAIDFYVPSLDGQLVAVSLSEGGSENGSIHVFEVASGKEFKDIVPRVQFPTGGGDCAWNKDASGFYYTRYPQGNERPKEDMNFYQQVYFHKLGTPSSEDRYVIGKEFPRIAETRLKTTNDARYLLATVANGDGGEYAHYLMNPSGKWKQVTKFSDKATYADFGPNDKLYLVSLNNAPNGKILSVPLSNPEIAKAETVVKESDVSIQHFLPTDNLLYIIYQVGGPSEIHVLNIANNRLKSIPTKPISSISGLVKIQGNEILFGCQTFIEPHAWYYFNPATEKISKTELITKSSVDYGDAEVIRDFAISKDGTKIPINIIRRKDIDLNGKNPTILYGYGGYKISLSPRFSARRHLWIEQGGVYILANLRGGGEYGEKWHKAGMLTKKQNVFDDFVACAKYLIEKRYTNPEKLAIEGGSNGGLLMGAVLTQHPELFRAVVSYVGIYDMLRSELFPNGSFNVPEFGTVKDAEQFKALYAYSPYHNVKNGEAYPAVLFLTGDNDGRVDPANSRKMAALLQSATSSNFPILLRTSSSSGHGIGTSLNEEIAEEADVYAFLFDQLHLSYQTIKGK